MALHEVVIVGAARTPMGSLKGALASFSGPKLGALAIEEALDRAQCPKDKVDAVYMGCAIPCLLYTSPSPRDS